ncbi:non-reducing end alpha-L-arabinofuranosidase family hydrolase [Streptosporangium longisporum]|uniref:non-reducing end alpha-L-arabinofuranosidase family hydrolase n=1 Tax=Streptosporangium longisporum TaxID=46187 RepID=UPI003CD0C3FB
MSTTTPPPRTRRRPAVGATFPRRTAGARRGVLANRGRVWVSLKGLHRRPLRGQAARLRTTPRLRQDWGSMNFGLFTNWSQMASAARTRCPPRRGGPLAVLLRPQEQSGC